MSAHMVAARLSCGASVVQRNLWSGPAGCGETWEGGTWNARETSCDALKSERSKAQIEIAWMRARCDSLSLSPMYPSPRCSMYMNSVHERLCL